MIVAGDCALVCAGRIAGVARMAAAARVITERIIAPGGFEPPFSDPKTDVLPLDEGAEGVKLADPHWLNNVD